jgi:hypothetical protein
MPDSAIVVVLGTLLLIVFMLWFAFGTQGNIRRGNDFLRWLQGGLPLLGRRTGLRWLGSSAVVLNIVEPHEPFTEAEVLVVLEPRDLGWLWAWSRSRGRRDFIVMRGRLVKPPHFELEAGDPSGWTGRDRLDKLDLAHWHQTNWGEVRVAFTRDADAGDVRRHWDNLSSCCGRVWRMSIRRDRPHVEVHVIPPDTSTVGADELIKAFREMCKAVMRVA